MSLSIKFKRTNHSAPPDTLDFGEPAWVDQDNMLYIGKSDGTTVGVQFAGKVQPLNARLSEIAALTPALGSVIVGNGSGFILQTPETFASTLGLGSAAKASVNDFVTPGQLGQLLLGLVSTNDPRLSDSRPPVGPAGGSFKGNFPNPELSDSGVNAGTYTLANITINREGRIIAAENGTVPAQGVTSVGLAMPSEFTVTNDGPITGSGTLTVSKSQQAAGLIYASPIGAAGVPSFRALADSDIPNAIARVSQVNAALSNVVSTNDPRLGDERVPPDGSVSDAKLGLRTINPAITQPRAETGFLTQLLSWFAQSLQLITGKPSWRDAPAINLETAALHITATNNPHQVTHTQIGAEPAGAAAQAASAHEDKANPHPQYVDEAELNAAIANFSSGISGPSNPTQNAIARYDATGNLANSTATIDNSGNVATPTGISANSVFSANGFTTDGGLYLTNAQTEGSGIIFSNTSGQSWNLFMDTGANAVRISTSGNGLTVNSNGRIDATGARLLGLTQVAGAGLAVTTSTAAATDPGAGNAAIAGTLAIAATTASTNTTTGALTVAGGIASGDAIVAKRFRSTVNIGDTNTHAINAFAAAGITANTGRQVLSIATNNASGVWASIGGGIDGQLESTLYPAIRFYSVDRVLAFWNNSAERMRIASDGKVGIGTTSPGTLLQVAGGGLAVTTSTAAATDPGAGNVAIAGTTTTTKLRVQNTAITPSAAGDNYVELSVTDGGGFPVLQFGRANNGQTYLAGGSGGFIFTGQIAASGSILTGGATPTLGVNGVGSLKITSGGASPINFFTNSTQKATILSDGKFGIGTTTPGALLQVAGGGLAVSFGTSAVTDPGAGNVSIAGTTNIGGHITFGEGNSLATGTTFAIKNSTNSRWWSFSLVGKATTTEPEGNKMTLSNANTGVGRIQSWDAVDRKIHFFESSFGVNSSFDLSAGDAENAVKISCGPNHTAKALSVGKMVSGAYVERLSIGNNGAIATTGSLQSGGLTHVAGAGLAVTSSTATPTDPGAGNATISGSLAVGSLTVNGVAITGNGGGPASTTQYAIARYSNTTGTLANSTATIDDNGAIATPGNITVNATGSSEASPKLIQFSGLTAGTAVRVQFGDNFNSWSTANGKAMQLRSYHHLELLGGAEDSAVNFSDNANYGVFVRNQKPARTAFNIRLANSQSANALTVENNAATELFRVTATGDMQLSATGSTTVTPRVLGFRNLGSGNAVELQFGDNVNVLRAVFGQALQMISYHQLELNGGAEAATITGAEANANYGVLVRNHRPARHALTIRGAASQTSQLLRLENNGGTEVFAIAAAGAVTTKALTQVAGAGLAVTVSTGAATDPGAGNLVVEGAIAAGVKTVATLPASGSIGQMYYCSDARWSGGTGCDVRWNIGGFWATPDGVKASTDGYQRSISANRLLDRSDRHIWATAAGIDITLPLISAAPFVPYRIRNFSSGDIFILTSGSDLIEGQTSLTIPVNSSVDVENNGISEWRVM